MKRLIITLFCAALLCPVLTGCQSTKPQSEVRQFADLKQMCTAARDEHAKVQPMISSGKLSKKQGDKINVAWKSFLREMQAELKDAHTKEEKDKILEAPPSAKAVKAFKDWTLTLPPP